jgi:hypothetical protein
VLWTNSFQISAGEQDVLIETPSDIRQPFPDIHLILSLIRLHRDLAGK